MILWPAGKGSLILINAVFLGELSACRATEATYRFSSYQAEHTKFLGWVAPLAAAPASFVRCAAVRFPPRH